MRYGWLLLVALLAAAAVYATPASSQTNAGATKASQSLQADRKIRRLCAELKRLGAGPDALKLCGYEAALISADPGAHLGAPRKSAVDASTRTSQIEPPASPEDFHEGFFTILRQDQYDELSFVIPPPSGGGGTQVLQGASLTYQDDQVAAKQSATINALLGVSAYNGISQSVTCDAKHAPALSGYGFGAFVLGDGTYNQPTSATEKSALRFSLDADSQLCNMPIVSQQEYQLMPYYQTDFRGKASIEGFDGLWELFDRDYHLGGRTSVAEPRDDAIVSYYFRVLAEANTFYVGNPGLTDFAANRTYALFGDTTQIKTVLFENNNKVPAFLCGRISLIGVARELWGVQKPIYLYGGEVDYSLTGNASNAKCAGAAGDVGSSVNGSISFSYTQGTDPATLVKQNIYKAGFKLGF